MKHAVRSMQTVCEARACAISGKGSKRSVRRVDVQNFAMPQLKY